MTRRAYNSIRLAVKTSRPHIFNELFTLKKASEDSQKTCASRFIQLILSNYYTNLIL